MKSISTTAAQHYTFVCLFFFSLLFNPLYGQVANLDWAVGTNASSAASAVGRITTADSLGNVYVVGTFYGRVDFDPGRGQVNYTSSGSTADVFIQKFDPSGNLLWAKRIGTGNFIGAVDIDIDAAGILYITGFVEGTVDMDPGPGVANYSAGVARTDQYTLKLDTDGNYIEVIPVGGSGDMSSPGAVMSEQGELWRWGVFEGQVDLDPGPGFVNAYALNNKDIFIQKIDTGGNYIWSRTIGSANDEFIHDVNTDARGNVYMIGHYRGRVDFDPGIDTFELTTLPSYTHDYLVKLDANGDFVWAKNMGISTSFDHHIDIDSFGGLYITSKYRGTADFDPGPGQVSLTAMGWEDAYIQKLDTNGVFQWVRTIGGTGSAASRDIDIDKYGHIYITGFYTGTVGVNTPSGVIHTMTAVGGSDVYMAKMDRDGSLLWAESIGNNAPGDIYNVKVDKKGNIYATGEFDGTVNFGLAGAPFLLTGNQDAFVMKLNQKKIRGHVFHDFNQNCVQDSLELGLSNRLLIINPGNIVVSTDKRGIWLLDSLPVGTYSISVDTSGHWTPTCPITQQFSVIHPDSIVLAPPFGLKATFSCAIPYISIHAPILRPGFANQRVYAQACNEHTSTAVLYNPYAIVELDSLMVPQTGSLPFTPLGNNGYRIDLDSLYPGQCIDFWLDCAIDSSAILGQTLCMEAVLYPLDNCALDTIPSPYNTTSLGKAPISPCHTLYDSSSLAIESTCINDSIHFIIYNMGMGDMTCMAPVRLYIDGQFIWSDSIQLLSMQSTTYVFSGDGRTWRMEADQHPLHPGNSQPSTTIELCGGDFVNWTSDLVNVLPHDDQEPRKQIYCGVVTGSYDPNDKTGYPLGLGTHHAIAQNQALNYTIRFQNTGTDTAFTVVIRDTLSTDLDIFSVRSGASSHNYNFRIYGPRVLEWTFNHIMLPDSNVNEAASHGFVKFTVNQASNLPVQTVVENNAAIYFDFNAPIITNTTFHTIDTPSVLDWAGLDTINMGACDSLWFDSVLYTQSGMYWQTNDNMDSLYWLQVVVDSVPSNTVLQQGISLVAEASGASYQWLDCDNAYAPINGATNQSFSPLVSGNYAVQITNGYCVSISNCTNVTVIGKTQIKNFLGVNVYPNPTTSLLYIDKGKNTTLSVQVVDQLGRTLLVQDCIHPVSEINLSNIPTGLYYVELDNGFQRERKKVLKK